MMGKKETQIPDSYKLLIPESKSNSSIRICEMRGDGELDGRRERRAHIRYSSNKQARFFYGDMVYEGMITDISEKGMFISTDIRFSQSQLLDIMLVINEKVFKIPVTVRRSVRQDSIGFNGVGVELLRPHHAYLDYVTAIMSA